MQTSFDTAANYNVIRAENIISHNSQTKAHVVVEHNHQSPDILIGKLSHMHVHELLSELFLIQSCKEFHKTRKFEWLQENDHDVPCLALSNAIGEDKQMILVLNFRLAKLLNKKHSKPKRIVTTSSNGENSYTYFGDISS